VGFLLTGFLDKSALRAEAASRAGGLPSLGRRGRPRPVTASLRPSRQTGGTQAVTQGPRNRSPLVSKRSRTRTLIRYSGPAIVNTLYP